MPFDDDALLLMAEVFEQDEHFVIISPDSPNDVGFRVLKDDVEVIDSDAGPTSLGVPESRKIRFAIHLNAKCVRISAEIVRDMIAEIPAIVEVYDQPVDVTSPRVVSAKSLLAAYATYVLGCSEFVCDVLGLGTSENANSLMGDSPTYVGDNNNYPGLVPGDIVGWKIGGGSGHVAVYIGEQGAKFIDVRAPGAKPRKVVNGYGNGRALFKSSKY